MFKFELIISFKNLIVMIKKLLFILTIISTATLTAQTTFDLLNSNDNSISGTNHYEFGDGPTLSGIKFHVKNLTGTTASYTCDVQEMSNVVAQTDLQVCYGTSCFVASGGDPLVQVIGGSSTVAGAATDVTFKVAPFSFGWVVGDEATWRIVVRNVANANDTVSAVVTYKVTGVSIEEVLSSHVSITAYPNPAIDNLTVNYSIDGSADNSRLDVYDVLGQVVSTHPLNRNKGTLNLNVDHLNAGVYFYTIKVNEKTVRTERLIIK